MTKVISIFCDGTWQTNEQNSPTNIGLLHQAVTEQDADGVKQVTRHFNGVATNGGYLRKLFNGITGADIKEKIIEAYAYLVENYEPGDQVVLLGFSRGAYTVRSLNGMIYNCGLLRPGATPEDLEDAYALYRSKHKPSSKVAQRFREKHAIKGRSKVVLACFDTVGSLGIPLKFDIFSIFNLGQRCCQFHDTTINRNTIAAFQAAAIDEQREKFPLTPMVADDSDTDIQVAWFAGHHAAIGGGDTHKENNQLAAIAAMWIADQLGRKTRLRFDRNKLNRLFSPDHLANPKSDFRQNRFWTFLGGWTRRKIPNDSEIHESARNRIDKLPTYNPENVPAI